MLPSDVAVRSFRYLFQNIFEWAVSEIIRNKQRSYKWSLSRDTLRYIMNGEIPIKDIIERAGGKLDAIYLSSISCRPFKAIDRLKDGALKLYSSYRTLNLISKWKRTEVVERVLASNLFNWGTRRNDLNIGWRFWWCEMRFLKYELVSELRILLSLF